MGNKQEILNAEILTEIGFSPLPHFTVAGSLIYELGRNRQLSLGCVGTPNESLWICEVDAENSEKITDLVCLHSYDYDGYLSKDKIQAIIDSIGKSVKIYKNNNVN